MTDIDIRVTEMGEVDLTRAIMMFPALLFFQDIVIETITRVLQDMVSHGASVTTMQTIVNTDRFAIMVGGSIYAQLQNDPGYGCDGGRSEAVPDRLS